MSHESEKLESEKVRELEEREINFHSVVVFVCCSVEVGPSFSVAETSVH